MLPAASPRGRGAKSGGDAYTGDNTVPGGDTNRAVQDAGGVTAAGSDAPVETRDPRPFVNLAHAITRRNPGGKALNAAQDLTVDEAIDAYTINGARMLGIDEDAGSLDVGKSADFIVLDRDIVQLAADGRADDIAKTRVKQTWFRGKQVYPLRGTLNAER